MPDNIQPDADNVQPQGYPYAGPDQITVPVSQQGYASYADQKTVSAPPDAEAPTVYYDSQSMPQGTMLAGAAIRPNGAPNSPNKKPISKKILLGGSIVLVLLILAIAGFLFVPKLMGGTNSQTVATPTPIANTNPAAGNVYAPYLTQNRTAIRSQIAQGLHLSDDQLQTQLSSGKTLSQIATAQGISPTQLQSIITNAFQTSFQPTIDSGQLTQKQVDALVRRVLKQPNTLDRLLVVRARKNAGAVATPVSQ